MATSDLPRLRIARLELRDFRGIDHLELDLTDKDQNPLDLAVFAGGNGCGKTAVLEAAILLLGMPEALPKDTALRREQIRFGAKEFRLDARLRVLRENQQTGFDARFHVGLATPDTRTAVSFGLGTSRQIPAGWAWDNRGGPEAPPPAIEYFSARREPEALGETPDPRGAQSPAESHRIRELKRRLISMYYRNLRIAKQIPNGDNTPFARIRQFWERFDPQHRALDVIPVSNDPGSGDEVVLRDGGLIPEDVTSLAMARQLAPTRADIPRMVPLDRLSSGQMALFGFAGPLIFRDTPADIVLIDEPEQHLHIQWQRHLLPALRELSPTTQFLVATHSEEILESVLSYERFILVDDADPRARVDTSGDIAKSA